MNYHFTILFSLFICLGINAQQQQDYSRVKVKLYSEADFQRLGSLGLEVDHGKYAPERYFINDFSKKEIQQIRDAGFDYEILIEDVVKHYQTQNEQPPTAELRSNDCFGDAAADWEVPENFELGSMGGFLTYQEMLDNLDSMAAKYPNLISPREPIPDILTHEDRPIYWLRISDNPNEDEETEPEVFYNAIHHAREPNALSQLIFYMWYLLENYEEDEEIKYLVDNIEMYFVPCINPDGYIYNEFIAPDGGGLWRKNRSENADGSFGVDLNRNYGFEWGYDDNGSSPNPPSQVYRGTGPFSEPETQAMRDFCNMHEFVIALNYHTFGNLLIYPWGYSDEIVESEVFVPLAELLTSENNYLAGTATETVGYQVNGTSDDWMYGEQTTKPKIYSMTPEVGTTGFWPAEFEIVDLCKGTMLMNINTARAVLNYGILEQNSPLFINQLNNKIDFSLERIGLSGGDFTVSLEGLSDNVLTTDAPMDVNLIPFEILEDEINYTLNPAIEPGETIQLILSLDNGITIFSDTLTKYYGQPAPLFQEMAENMGSWDFGGNDNWFTTDEDFVSPPRSITDSPFGDYDDNISSYIQMENFVEIPVDAQTAWLTYYAKWEIEANFDWAQVSISTDGTNFTPLCGKYTKAGTEDQDPGQPVYDGVSGVWLFEEIDLSNHIGEEVIIRFSMNSDGAVDGDGFYFDDLEINYLRGEITSSTALSSEDFEFITLRPNPADQKVWVEFDKPIAQGVTAELNIYNSYGQLMHTQPIDGSVGNKLEINTSSWPNGIYFYQWLADDQLISTKRLSVNR